MQLTALSLLAILLAAPGTPVKHQAQKPSDAPQATSVAPRTPQQLPAADCVFKVLKEGDPVLGGYNLQQADSGGFDPNNTAHGGQVTPDVLRERMFYYYFEVQAIIGGKAGTVNKSDWDFNQSLDRSGWVTVKMADGKPSPKIDLALHKAADNPGRGEFAWDSKGYHYASFHGVDVLLPGPDNRLHPIESGDVTWKFTMTGYHDSNGEHDAVCASLSFSIRLTIENGVPWWTFKQEK